MNAVANSPVGETISAQSILEEVRGAGIDYVITVPDIWTAGSVLTEVAKEPGFRHIKVCKEDEGFGISAGLSFCNRRSMLLIQNTGLLDSINALRAVGMEYGLPICAMVGLLEKEPDISPSRSANYGVRIVQPILEAMGVRSVLVETEPDRQLIGETIVRAYETSSPAVILLGRRPRALA